MQGPQRQRRVGLREVAQKAGVCLMTVSLSLRDNPKISEATRSKVRQAAEALGYRPDPEISRLMGRLRPQRRSDRGVAIALADLCSSPAARVHPYNLGVREGATRRAQSLGFQTGYFPLDDYRGNIEVLLRVVRSRGITGVLLLPSDTPLHLPSGTLWDGLSVVAATTSVLEPRFHRVVPNQLGNTLRLIETMQARGYKKLGAILSESMEQRSTHHHSLALAWHGHRKRILILPDGETPEESERRIARWLKLHEVDLIMVQNTSVVERALRATLKSQEGTRPALVSLSTLSSSDVSFQDELPSHIGEKAVNLLMGMMHHNETGVPIHPSATTIDGEFHQASSIRFLRKGS